MCLETLSCPPNTITTLTLTPPSPLLTAITYECIRTVTSIYPNGGLIEKVSRSVDRLLVTSNNNWRYLGIQALSQLVQVNPKYALDHQLVVIDCLDDVDETLKRKVKILKGHTFGHTHHFNFCLRNHTIRKRWSSLATPTVYVHVSKQPFYFPPPSPLPFLFRRWTCCSR